MKHVLHAALRVAIVAAIAEVALSQQSQTPPSFIAMNPNELGWPTSWSAPGSFTRTASGFLNRDTWRDVVLLAGTHPVVLLDPAIYSLYHDLGVTANDIDVATAAGIGGRDAVAIVNSNGLQIVRVDNQYPPSYEVVTKSSNAKWQDAIKVRCGDIEGDSDADYVGLRSNGTEVVGWFEGSSTVCAFTRSSTILDMALGLFDGDSNLDLVLVYSDGIEFVQATSSNFGTTIKSFTHPSATPVTVAMGVVPPKVGSLTDRARAIVIAKSGAASSPPKALLTYSVPASTAHSVTLPTNATYVSLASGDIDDDGDFDLVVGVRRWFAPIFFRNQSASYPDPTDAVFYAPTSPVTWGELSIDDHAVLTDAVASNNAATPVFAQLSEDRFADLLIPLQQTTTTLGDHPASIYLEARVQGDSGAPPLPTPIFANGFIDASTQGGNLRRVYVSIKSAIIDDWLPLGLNGAEVTVWKQANESALVSLDPLYFAIHPLTDYLSNTYVGLGFDIEIPDACFTENSENFLLWVTVSPIHYTGTNPADVTPCTPRPYIGGIAANEPDLCTYVCLNESDVEVHAMNNFHSPSVWGSTPISGCGGSAACIDDGGLGSWQAPAIAPRKRMPQLQPGTFPTESTMHHTATQPYPTAAY